MREIKFRAWDYKMKRMVPVSSITFPNENHPMFITPMTSVSPDTAEADKLIPLQFTGLYDKNGKEIYEGDIMAHTYQGQNVLTVVEWNRARMGWSGVDVKYIMSDGYVVVGNIYEKTAH